MLRNLGLTLDDLESESDAVVCSTFTAEVVAAFQQEADAAIAEARARPDEGTKRRVLATAARVQQRGSPDRCPDAFAGDPVADLVEAARDVTKAIGRTLLPDPTCRDIDRLVATLAEGQALGIADEDPISDVGEKFIELLGMCDLWEGRVEYAIWLPDSVEPAQIATTLRSSGPKIWTEYHTLRIAVHTSALATTPNELLDFEGTDDIKTDFAEVVYRRDVPGTEICSFPVFDATLAAVDVNASTCNLGGFLGCGIAGDCDLPISKAIARSLSESLSDELATAVQVAFADPFLNYGGSAFTPSPPPPCDLLDPDKKVADACFAFILSDLRAAAMTYQVHEWFYDAFGPIGPASGFLDVSVASSTRDGLGTEPVKVGVWEFTHSEPDSDRIAMTVDTCPYDSDPSNRDSDGDGLGDACDGCPCSPGENDPDRHGDADGTCDTCTVIAGSPTCTVAFCSDPKNNDNCDLRNEWRLLGGAPEVTRPSCVSIDCECDLDCRGGLACDHSCGLLGCYGFCREMRFCETADACEPNERLRGAIVAVLPGEPGGLRAADVRPR